MLHLIIKFYSTISFSLFFKFGITLVISSNIIFNVNQTAPKEYPANTELKSFLKNKLVNPVAQLITKNIITIAFLTILLLICLINIYPVKPYIIITVKHLPSNKFLNISILELNILTI